MRYGFVTCVRLGQACIEEILGSGSRIHALVTLRDDVARTKSGRVYLDDLSEKHGIPLSKVGHINEPAAVAHLRDADLDWLFIVGWSQIAGPEVLATARRGVLGMHPTLLPEGRGRASIPWAILKGLDRTGVSLFRLAEGVDTGPVLAQEVIEISPTETATTLYEKTVAAHLSLLRAAWPRLESGSIEERPQDETRATVWPGRRPKDGEIRPEIMTVEQVDRLVRATTHPYPGAFIRRDDGTVLRVWSGSRATRPTRGVGLRLVDGWYEVGAHDVESAREDHQVPDRTAVGGPE